MEMEIYFTWILFSIQSLNIRNDDGKRLFVVGTFIKLFSCQNFGENLFVIKKLDCITDIQIFKKEYLHFDYEFSFFSVSRMQTGVIDVKMRWCRGIVDAETSSKM